MMAPSVWLSVLCLFAAADFALCDSVDVDRTLTVTTLLTEPFARYECQTTAPQQLGGYIIDLLDELSESVSDVHLHFDVTPVADGKYGDFVERNWNGMMGEITGSRPTDVVTSDLFPPTAGTQPPLSAEQWLAGVDRDPTLVPLISPGARLTQPTDTSKQSVRRSGNVVDDSRSAAGARNTTPNVVSVSGGERRNNGLVRPSRLLPRDRVDHGVADAGRPADTSKSFSGSQHRRHPSDNRHGGARTALIARRTGEQADADDDDDAGRSRSASKSGAAIENRRQQQNDVLTRRRAAAENGSSSWPVDHKDLLEKYFQQLDEIKALKELVRCREKKIRRLEDQLRIFSRTTTTRPSAS